MSPSASFSPGLTSTLNEPCIFIYSPLFLFSSSFTSLLWLFLFVSSCAYLALCRLICQSVRFFDAFINCIYWMMLQKLIWMSIVWTILMELSFLQSPVVHRFIEYVQFLVVCLFTGLYHGESLGVEWFLNLDNYSPLPVCLLFAKLARVNWNYCLYGLSHSSLSSEKRPSCLSFLQATAFAPSCPVVRSGYLHLELWPGWFALLSVDWWPNPAVN